MNAEQVDLLNFLLTFKGENVTARSTFEATEIAGRVLALDPTARVRFERRTGGRWFVLVGNLCRCVGRADSLDDAVAGVDALGFCGRKTRYVHVNGAKIGTKLAEYQANPF